MPPAGQAGSGPEAAPPLPPFRRRLAALKNRLGGLTGWRRMAAAGGLGVLGASALPPLYMLPLLIPAFTGLVWLVESAPGPRRASSAGWWFGFGHGVAGFYWIVFPFTVDAPQYGWMAPFALGGMAVGMALFPAAAAWLSRLAFDTGRLGPAGRVVVFGALWTAAEWARGEVLTGFPWNLMGTVWVVSDAMIQLAAVTGVYGLSLLAVVTAAMPATLAETGAPGGGRRRGWVPVAAAFLVLGAVWFGGQTRLAAPGNETVPGVRLRLVQPNIPQALKWRRDLRAGHVLKQLEMSRRPAPSGQPPTHIIWAETSVPYFLAGEPGLMVALARAAPPGGLIIIGAPRAEASEGSPKRLFNALQAIDSEGRVRGTYDKFHLVPFGEYVPFRDIVNIGKLTAGRQDFSPGPGVRTLVLKGLPPVSPLICFEVIFPGRVADPHDRPQWLLNLTNDAWFGSSSGPYQHFAAARLRAVEEGLPLVRVANTGISGVIDAYGRVLHRLELGRAGIIDSPLPSALARGTPFSRWGHWITGLIIALSLAAGFLLIPLHSARK